MLSSLTAVPVPSCAKTAIPTYYCAASASNCVAKCYATPAKILSVMSLEIQLYFIVWHMCVHFRHQYLDAQSVTMITHNLRYSFFTICNLHSHIGLEYVV